MSTDQALVSGDGGRSGLGPRDGVESGHGGWMGWVVKVMVEEEEGRREGEGVRTGEAGEEVDEEG